MTARTCPTCRGVKMLRRTPSAMALYPSLAIEKPEVSFVCCPDCKCSGYQVWTGAKWEAGQPAVIRLN